MNPELRRLAFLVGAGWPAGPFSTRALEFRRAPRGRNLHISPACKKLRNGSAVVHVMLDELAQHDFCSKCCKSRPPWYRDEELESYFNALSTCVEADAIEYRIARESHRHPLTAARLYEELARAVDACTREYPELTRRTGDVTRRARGRARELVESRRNVLADGLDSVVDHIVIFELGPDTADADRETVLLATQHWPYVPVEQSKRSAPVIPLSWSGLRFFQHEHGVLAMPRSVAQRLDCNATGRAVAIPEGFSGDVTAAHLEALVALAGPHEITAELIGWALPQAQAIIGS